ncbi:MAG: hypothetical protein GWO41_02500, partial [candidate division Zixibacteria bacterium]|nr:hypothetical protein [candidate division Zixibacteria bacterium]NIW39511.1 hypothetical protein [candidate division Zixibacteria bacterium]NIX58778.1 hypothetical protein [candidate division Zixibacteria bacterium]
VALYTYDYHRGKAAMFEHKEDKIVFTKEINMEPDMQASGRFAEMLPPIN